MEYIVVHGWIGLPNGTKPKRGETVTTEELGDSLKRHLRNESIKVKGAPDPPPLPPVEGKKSDERRSIEKKGHGRR